VIIAAYWSLDRRPELSLLIAGSVVALAGEAMRLWAAGHLVKNAALTTDGPFGFTRHPLYFGSTLMGLGLCLASGVWWTFALVAAVFAVFYVPTALREESYLREVYGDEYARYRQSVPGLGVRLTRYRGGSGARAVPAGPAAAPYSFARMRDNGEHATALLTLGLLAIMWAKLALPVGAPTIGGGG
jgi:hypothetical protein